MKRREENKMSNISFENAKINQDNDGSITEREEKWQEAKNKSAYVNSSISIDMVRCRVRACVSRCCC